MPELIALKDVDGKYLYVNNILEKWFADNRENILDKSAYDFMSEKDAEFGTEEDRRVLTTKTSMSYESRFQYRDRSTRDVEVTRFPIFDKADGVVALGLVNRDITERKRTEENLRKIEEILHEGVEALPVGFAVYDSDDRLVMCNQKYRDSLLNNSHLLIPGMAFEDLIRSSAQLVASQRGIRDPEGYVQERVHSRKRSENTWVYQQSYGQWMETVDRPTKGGGFISVRTDTTELRQRQEQLRQAQKMEAVGQLTGGVAHDFNNLLAVIMGNAELLEGRLDARDASVAAIIDAAQRGSELTQRLLAFSRQRPLRPSAVDPAALVSGMSALLTRTLGETVEVETIATSEVWRVMADPGQLENALLNLAINARHAMPQGGKLTIECVNIRVEEGQARGDSNVNSGDYVVLSVSDTGEGMSEEVRAQAFEPFFTTKDVGEGSGLGLSMVYGFAKQSGGQATIYSEIAHGTTVTLYLPRAAPAGENTQTRREEPVARGRGEMILVLEDDPNVRALIRQVLIEYGYRVMEAADAKDAGKILAQGRPIDLLLSDVVLPGGTSGPAFVERIRAAQTDLKVIFMSGYPAETAKGSGFIEVDNVLLTKPFRGHELARVVGQVLGVDPVFSQGA